MKKKKSTLPILLPLVAAPIIARIVMACVRTDFDAAEWPRLVFVWPFRIMCLLEPFSTITPFVIVAVLTSVGFAVAKRSRIFAWVASSLFALYWLLITLLLYFAPTD